MAYLVCTFHLAPKHSPIRSMDAQVLADELGQPEGGLVVVHPGFFLRPREPAATIVSAGESHGLPKRGHVFRCGCEVAVMMLGDFGLFAPKTFGHGGLPGFTI
jgi:hypothetical protein